MNRTVRIARHNRLISELWLGLLFSLSLVGLPIQAQDQPEPVGTRKSSDTPGATTIIVEGRGPIVPPPVFYTARATSTVQVGTDRIEQTIQLTIKVIQGQPQTLSFGLKGDSQVIDAHGENLRSWSVRQVGVDRFLDLQVNENVTDLTTEIKLRSPQLRLRGSVEVELTHLTPGDSVGFESSVNIEYAPGVVGRVTAVEGFSPLGPAERTNHFRTTTGGQIRLSFARDGASPAPVDLVDMQLDGQTHDNGKSILFQLRGSAQVTEADAVITILSGNAAVTQIPNDPNYRLRLATDTSTPVYQLVFLRPGTFPIALDFVATLETLGNSSQRIDFTVAASAVVPLTLRGLDSELEFDRDQAMVVPLRNDDVWSGFLPATGRAQLHWKAVRQTGEGKLFFTTTAHVEAKVDAGLLRQEHQIDFHVLQGELSIYRLTLHGPGEILDVQGTNVIGWKVSDVGEARQLEATLSQPIAGEGQLRIRTQTTLSAFPVRVEGMRLNPLDTIRHSGYIRLTNLGSVRLEPTGLKGLTQLAPDQFPGETIEARQVFVYRFPASDYTFTIAADRIQPEVSLSELVLYELTDSDRVIRADLELDVREAAIRAWDLRIPSDYSVVAVTGATVADTIVASEIVDGRRNLKVIFNQDVEGRQLIGLHLEKSEPAAAGEWVLPRLEYPNTKTVRGDIGIMGAPGFRIAVGTSDLLVEKPISYFPKPAANLQQAFRVRAPDWSATMQIEQLERSIQSDLLHLYSLSEETVYGSALVNYFVTGSPVAEWKLTVPATLGNVVVDGQDVRTWRREGETLIVSLHQPVMGAYTLLLTFEEKPDKSSGVFQPGLVAPLEVQSERGFIQVVSPMQVEIETLLISDGMLKLDPLELPAEFRLLSTAPPLGTWQYTQRPFDINLKVNWFQPGTTVSQVVEFSEANSRVSQDGELVTDVLYFVKSRGQSMLKVRLPGEPVRLWEVSVNGQPVTARQAEDATLIPLPGGLDPNIPVEVSLRLGKPTVNEARPELALPLVFAPVLKTQWSIVGDETRVLVPTHGTVTPPVPVLRPSGFEWVANRGIAWLTLIGLLAAVGLWGQDKSGGWSGLAALCLAAAVAVALATAWVALTQTGPLLPLHLSLPILSTGDSVELQVQNLPKWQANLSWNGLIAIAAGLLAIVGSLAKIDRRLHRPLRWLGVFLVATGTLMQGDGAPLFFGLLALAILFLLLIPAAQSCRRSYVAWSQRRTEPRQEPQAVENEASNGGPSPATTALIFIAATLTGAGTSSAQTPAGFEAASSISQEWQISHRDAQLRAGGRIVLSGVPGDRFLLLRAPAVLTRFEGEGLRLTKSSLTGADSQENLVYIVSIPFKEPSADPDQPVAPDQPVDTPAESQQEAPTGATTVEYQATFEYQLEAIQLETGIPVLTGSAAVQEVKLDYDEAGWDVVSPTAARIEMLAAVDSTQAQVLLRPGEARLFLNPKARDVANEETQFFVEGSHLYLPGPGVVDGRHRLHIRTSQGQVQALNVMVPQGLTVSAVQGPVASWQFDADSGRLTLEIEPTATHAFDVAIETQRGLDPLPADVKLAPLKVADADGEVGLLAIAFGPEAQPEKAETEQMSAVNLGDFDASLMPNSQAVLHRVYRYGADGGELDLRVAPVDSEVRVVSKQVLSIGDERIVLSVNFVAEISRAGLFQLSFPLPAGLEVESLSGAALHHWAELTESGQRLIVLHLNGKTIGSQNFALALTGSPPTDISDWEIPRFTLAEATRQTGELIVRPTTGIRLRTVSRQNVSETDPRSLGGEAQGALAFRLLQRDWNLVLGLEQLDPWITGHVLHEITLREGQTRSALSAAFHVQNASIRSLQVSLPLSDENEINTLRATGETVSDFIRTAPDSDIWEVQFKRRVIGKIEFRIEFERRGDPGNENETLRPAEFPQARQLAYFVGIRAGGRLELELDRLTGGWQRVDWSTVPSALRDSENRNAPAFALRAVAPNSPLIIRAKRHALADALKLRVAKGTLTSVLSPSGDQLTAVDVTIDVIQRSSLSVGLPQGGELFSVSVNGESVNSIRLGQPTNAWQFTILPGIDDRTAQVRFVYSVDGAGLRPLRLTGPQLNVPLENIQWNVVAPEGYELIDSDGNMELVRQSNQQQYDRDSYLSKISGKRQVQAQQAAKLLEQANQFLQAGEQAKARWALSSVANQYALDAASNEDARVQLENLQTQQAIVGLNTRRQRLYLDNNPNESLAGDNQQLREAAADNPILQLDQLNFRPQQLSQLLRGNTTEDNAVLAQIAARLVQHQRTTAPAPQAIVISLPEEGAVYTFSRSVQVSENEPLTLELVFSSQYQLRLWQIALVLGVLGIVVGIVAWSRRQPIRDREPEIQSA